MIPILLLATTLPTLAFADGAVGNVDVATICAETKASVKMLQFIVNSSIVEPERYSEIIVDQFVAEQDKLIIGHQKLQLMAGPATYSFLFENEDRIALLVAAAKRLFSGRDGADKEATMELLTRYSKDSEEVSLELTSRCRSDFQGMEY